MFKKNNKIHLWLDLYIIIILIYRYEMFDGWYWRWWHSTGKSRWLYYTAYQLLLTTLVEPYSNDAQIQITQRNVESEDEGS